MVETQLLLVDQFRDEMINSKSNCIIESQGIAPNRACPETLLSAGAERSDQSLQKKKWILPFRMATLFIFLASTLEACVSVEVKPLITDTYANAISDEYFKADGLHAQRNKYDACLDDPCRITIRNKTLDELTYLSDYYYHDFKGSLYNNQTLFHTFTDISELALTGMASITGSAASKSAMAAGSSFIKGSSSSIDKNYYAQQTIQSLINVMDEQRDKVKTHMVDGRKKSPTEYSFESAIADIDLYHQKASLIVAITELSKKTGTDSKKANDALNTALF